MDQSFWPQDHVIRQPESLRQAVRTALAAGLIAIVAPAGPADWELLRQAVPADRLVGADNVQLGMEAVARLGRSEEQTWVEFPSACCRRSLNRTTPTICSPSVGAFRLHLDQPRSCRYFAK